MSDCIFCKLANGEIPTTALYEDDDFKIILDMGPASKGHALILPKEHHADLFDMPDELIGKAFALAKKAAAKLKRVLGADGINIVQNNGSAEGQTVFHFHIHLIPRYEGEPVIVGWNPGKLTDEMREEIVGKWNEE